MSELFLLNKPQMARLSPHFLPAHGVPHADDMSRTTISPDILSGWNVGAIPRIQIFATSAN
jgi:hypothetical protein